MTMNSTQEFNPLSLREESMEEQITALAHRIWEEEGKPEGMADDHWYRAVTIITEMAQLPNPNWLLKAPNEQDMQLERKLNLAASIEEIKRKIVGRAA